MRRVGNFLLCALEFGGLGSASGVSESCSNGSSVSSGVMVRADVKQCRMDSVRKYWYHVQIIFCYYVLYSINTHYASYYGHSNNDVIICNNDVIICN